MSKAEKFIQDCTRGCSNLVYKDTINGKEFNTYNEWLTPDQARRAVEIAREEVIEWIDSHWREYVWLTDNNIIHFGHWKKDLKQAMKDE